MHGAVCPPFNICVFITFEERTSAIVRYDCASGECNTSDSAVLMFITNDGDAEDDVDNDDDEIALQWIGACLNATNQKWQSKKLREISH